MEKYSKHLEDLVKERTKELNIEQKRTAELLYRKSDDDNSYKPLEVRSIWIINCD